MTDFNAAMRKAANLTRAYNLVEATRVIQDALAGRRPAASGDQATNPLPLALPKPEKALAKGNDDASASAPKFEAASVDIAAQRPGNAATAPAKRQRKPLGEIVRILREGRLLAPRLLERAEQRPEIKTPSGAQYLTRTFSSTAGVRSYKLYIPANSGRQPRGLIVMLHGCNQNPDDFAAGTAMNDLAEMNGLLVAYPHQTRANNPSACWNWFRPKDQMRGRGEPAILAGIARELASEFNLGRKRTFVAGLSAGGAMAMVMAETYPDVFGAVGIHSGLDYQSASDVASAFAAMRGSRSPQVVSPQPDKFTVRTIVFHGASDRTVNPSNADRISARLRLSAAPHTISKTQRCDGYSRVTFGPEKAPPLETWSVDNLGHAWSGGNSAGSFTDERGPDASAEMVRFFLESE
jgi:poly(hydroxyalkanoate) depolymerase family esterase